MKKKIRLIVIISIIFIFLIYEIPVWARYYENINKISGKAVIAEPIIKVIPLNNTIITDVNKLSNIQEYHFIIKNYETDLNNKKRVNEVDFLYDIEIKNSSNSFPIRYELYDISTNEELLKGDSKITNLIIEKNKEMEKEYKLKVYWEKKENMSSSNDIDVIVKVNQKNI